MKGFLTEEQYAQQRQITKEQETQETIIQRFPAYNFTPVSLVKAHPTQLKLWLFGCVLLSSIPLWFFAVYLAFGMSLGDSLGIDEDAIFVFVFIFLLVVIFLCWYYGWFRRKSLLKIADYVQEQNGLVFFVKDGKFGLINRKNNKILIHAIYDYLTWMIEDKIIIAQQGNNTFQIDIYNNILK